MVEIKPAYEFIQCVVCLRKQEQLGPMNQLTVYCTNEHVVCKACAQAMRARKNSRCPLCRLKKQNLFPLPLKVLSSYNNKISELYEKDTVIKAHAARINRWKLYAAATRRRLKSRQNILARQEKIMQAHQAAIAKKDEEICIQKDKLEEMNETIANLRKQIAGKKQQFQVMAISQDETQPEPVLSQSQIQACKIRFERWKQYFHKISCELKLFRGLQSPSKAQIRETAEKVYLYCLKANALMTCQCIDELMKDTPYSIKAKVHRSEHTRLLRKEEIRRKMASESKEERESRIAISKRFKELFKTRRRPIKSRLDK